ncbi:MAG: hypothetical protein OHK006_23870 [Thermodesulfovibrionales bacterium]
MKNTHSLLTVLLAVLLFVGAAAGVAFPQSATEASDLAPEAASDNPDAPEPPKEITNIEYQDGLLSVELLNADFRKVLTGIGQKAGFSIEGYSEAFSKKLTTKFQDIELERGVARLLTLVSEKNYLVNYTAEGGIKSLELYGVAGPPKTTTKPTPTTRPMTKTTSPSALSRTPQPAAPAPLPPVPQASLPAAQQPADQVPAPNVPAAVVGTPRPAVSPTRPPISRRMRFIRRQGTVPQPQPSAPSQDQPVQENPEAPPPDTPDSPPSEEQAQEVPYIPQQAPVFVPSRSR